MKRPEFLKRIHIGEIIRKEMKQQHLTVPMFAEMLHCKKWIVREILEKKSIKINSLIEISYALKVNFLQIYLREMSEFKNSELFEDEIIIEIINGQLFLIPSKKSKTATFTQSIHIGNILKKGVRKQNIPKEILQEFLCCSQSAINRMFLNPDIDIERLILMSYALNFDFIYNIYLPYMATNESKMIANECISGSCIIKINTKTVFIIKEKQTDIYRRM